MKRGIAPLILIGIIIVAAAIASVTGVEVGAKLETEPESILHGFQNWAEDVKLSYTNTPEYTLYLAQKRANEGKYLEMQLMVGKAGEINPCFKDLKTPEQITSALEDKDFLLECAKQNLQSNQKVVFEATNPYTTDIGNYCESLKKPFLLCSDPTNNENTEDYFASLCIYQDTNCLERTVLGENVSPKPFQIKINNGHLYT
ncbi:MAG: hypothetical protein KAS30_03555, partial [Candidatus Diapherotrites archaeon]|nr:hypothetical protein [Candidatus Diapherotrites archaeon]